jgi:N-formylglutamate deformylase
MANLKPILHIPHSSTTIPSEYRDRFLLSDECLATEMLRMTDHFTDELFSRIGGTEIVFPVSRLLVDVERFEDDAHEAMAKKGMGVLYTKTHAQHPLRACPTAEEREVLLNAFYRPHHQALTGLVDVQLEQCGKALLIDCHSFPSKPLPYQTVRAGDLPEICIGTDDIHTANSLRDAALIGFAKRGLTVGLNHPFSGALTPLKHYRKNASVQAIMVEVRRDLYMDETTGDRSSDFSKTQEALTLVLRDMIAAS